MSANDESMKVLETRVEELDDRCELRESLLAEKDRLLGEEIAKLYERVGALERALRSGAEGLP